MKKLFLAALIGIVGLASCSKDDPDNQTQKFRAGAGSIWTGAKYLVLSESPVSKSTGAPSDVFKVDENGNRRLLSYSISRMITTGHSQQSPHRCESRTAKDFQEPRRRTIYVIP